MAWEIYSVPEFEEWFLSLNRKEKKAFAAALSVLRDKGPQLGYPNSSKVRRSRHSQMRELRVQNAGRPYRVLYAFDPLRTAVLLLGGDKTGKDRWYEINVPIADWRLEQHLESLRKEGLI